MNELKHPEKFISLLASYHPSPDVQRILNDIKLVALVAPTSAGRNTIIRALLKTGRYHFIISDTTRSPRVNDGVLEKDGSVYWFRKEEDFLNDLKEGRFLEAEIIHGQQVSGISIRELEKARKERRVAITDLDIGGVRNVLNIKRDTVAIVVLPPNFEEWHRRIEKRGVMDNDELIRRIKTAHNIFTQALESKRAIFIINDDIEKASEQIDNIVTSGLIHEDNQEMARKLLVELNRETEKFLKTNA